MRLRITCTNGLRAFDSAGLLLTTSVIPPVVRAADVATHRGWVASGVGLLWAGRGLSAHGVLA